MSVKNAKKNQKPRRLFGFWSAKIFMQGIKKSISIENAPLDVVLLINFLTEKLSFAVKQNCGVDYQRIGENSFPNWTFRSIRIQASMQKSEKAVFLWST